MRSSPGSRGDATSTAHASPASSPSMSASKPPQVNTRCLMHPTDGEKHLSFLLGQLRAGIELLRCGFGIIWSGGFTLALPRSYRGSEGTGMH